MKMKIHKFKAHFFCNVHFTFGGRTIKSVQSWSCHKHNYYKWYIQAHMILIDFVLRQWCFCHLALITEIILQLSLKFLWPQALSPTTQNSLRTIPQLTNRPVSSLCPTLLLWNTWTGLYAEDDSSRKTVTTVRMMATQLVRSMCSSIQHPSQQQTFTILSSTKKM